MKPKPKLHYLLPAGLLFMLGISLAQKSAEEFPILTGAYLGQKAPGLTPEIFAPGIISTGYYERSIVFTPKGDEIFYQMRGRPQGRNFTSFILYLPLQKGVWRQPQIAFFSGIPAHRDDCPFISYDGKCLFFASKRPLPGTNAIQNEPDLWMIKRSDKRWGQPQHLGSAINSPAEDHYPTVSKMGNMYFNSNRDGNYEIYISSHTGTEWSAPVRLKAPVNTEYFEGHPFIAADESYLIFSSNRPGELGQADLYISFRQGDKSWSEPVNMGDKINSPFHEAAPYVSPDGRHLFFCSFRPPRKSQSSLKFSYSKDINALLDIPVKVSGDIYWVDARIITPLKPDDLK